MTKKDFELIAAAILLGRNEPTSTTNTAYNRGWTDGADAVAVYVAEALAKQFPRFDQSKFLIAAGAK